MDREKVIKAAEDYEPYAKFLSGITVTGELFLNMLALLREQETTDTRQARIFQCKECGYGIEDIFLTSEREYEMVPKYCPNCGRSVKRE